MGEPRRRVAVVIVVVILAFGVGGLGVYESQRAERHYVADLIGVGFKNRILALYCLLTAPPVVTVDLAPIDDASLPPNAVNVFLDQEVQPENDDRSLDQ